MSRYKNEDEIMAVVRSFEDATIGRDEWKHADHLAVAFHYVRTLGLEKGTEMMRNGILRLLSEGFGIDLSTEMPYHETLTVFWMRTTFAFYLLRKGSSTLDAVNELVEGFNKDFPLRFYSRELLFSDDARSEFRAPDLADLVLPLQEAL